MSGLYKPRCTAVGVGLIALVGVWFVAFCQNQEHPPQLNGERPIEPDPDPRCQEAAKSASAGIAHAEAARYDRAIEALSQALLSCKSTPFQRARRADLVRVLQLWSDASEAEGNLDRSLFLRDALLTLSPSSKRRLAHMDLLIATHRLTSARQALDELSRRASESIRPELAKRAHTLDLWEKQHPSQKADASASLEARAQLEQASLELLLGSPAKAAALAQEVTSRSPDSCSLGLLAEALWQNAQHKEARVAWSQALGLLGKSFEAREETSKLRFFGGREGAPKLSDDGRGYSLSSSAGTTSWYVSSGFRCLPKRTDSGQYIVQNAYDGRVMLSEQESDNEFKLIRVHKESVAVVATDRTNSYFATGGDDGSVKLWEIPSGKLVKSLGQHGGEVVEDGCGVCGTKATHWHETFPVSALRFGGRGKYVASCASGGTRDNQTGQVKLWEVPSGKLLKNLSLHSDVLDIALDPGGHYLASSQDYTVKVWALPSGKLLRTLKTNVGCGCAGYFHSIGTHDAESITIDSTGRYLAASLLDGRVLIWELPSGRHVKTLAGHSSQIRSLQIGAQQDYLAWGTARGHVKVWDLSTGQYSLDLHANTFSDEVRSVAIDPEGSGNIATAAGNLKLWSMPSGKLIKEVETGHFYGGTLSVVMDPEGNYFASGGGEGKVKLWAIPSAKLLKELPIRGRGSQRRDALSTSYWATGTQFGGVVLWSIDEERHVKTLESKASWVHSVALDAQGRYVVAGGRKGTTVVWEMPSGELLHRLDGYAGEVRAVAIDPTARYVFSGSKGRIIKIWSATSGELLHDLTGHSDAVRALAVDPDGRYLASGADDGMVKLWAIPSGELLATLHVSDDGEWLVLTPDGYVDGSHLGMRFVQYGDESGDSLAVGHLRKAIPQLLTRVISGDHDYRLTDFRLLLQRQRSGSP